MSQGHSPPYLCPACGYDISPPDHSTTFVCPECGNETDRSRSGREAWALGQRRFYLTSAWILMAPPFLGSLLSVLWFVDRAHAGWFESSGYALTMVWFLLSPVALVVAGAFVLLSFGAQPRGIRERLRLRWPLLFAMMGIFLGGGWVGALWLFSMLWEILTG